MSQRDVPYRNMSHGKRLIVDKKEDNSEGAITGLELAKRAQIEQSLTRDIRVEKFSLSYQSKVLFKDADLHISFGHKYGIIGPNGAGKSTLLRHISARHLPIPAHIRILHVEQEVQADDTTALNSVLLADEERSQLFAEEAKLKPISEENSEAGLVAGARLIEIYNRLRQINAYSAEARASTILSGLQFTEDMKQKPTKEFSGGWRMRIALARALFMNPDLLILDEPTNHLDLNATIWLEAYLRRWKKTLLIVSHDRDFLNYFVTDIIHLHNQQLKYFKGNYDIFEKSFDQIKRQQEKEYKKQQKQLDKIQQNQTTKDRQKKEKIQKLVKEREYTVKFKFEDPGKLNLPILQIKDVSFSWPNEQKVLFQHVELNIDMDSRIAIVGPNGAGKSTFMNLMLDELKPTIGEVIRNRHLRVTKFAQHFVDQLEMSRQASSSRRDEMNITPIDYLQKCFPDMTSLEIRGVLGRFGLKGATQTQSMALLSGGQKSRIMLANISLRKPHILFLDEPTNHLDIQSVDALAKALQDFSGGIVLITHDERLITSVCNKLWVIADGAINVFDGKFEDYKQNVINLMDDSLFEDSDAVSVSASSKSK